MTESNTGDEQRESETLTSDSRRESETLDANFSVLASTECRYVVYYFQDASEEVASLGDLARFVEAKLGPVTGRSREQTRVALHHNALPKLDQNGVVEYDRDGRVRYRGSANLEAFAAIAARNERRRT